MKIVDMHCDTIYELFVRKRRNLAHSLRSCDTGVDLVKMRESGYLLQNFAIFVDMAKADDPLMEALRMIRLYYDEIEKNGDLIAPVYRFADIAANEAGGRMSALLTVEEGGIAKGEPAVLSILHRLGVRMMTLTWNYENELGYPNSNLPRTAVSPGSRPCSTAEKGLTGTGILFLEEMERLGIIIDVSHLSDAGFYDVLRHTKKPFAASHSNARGLCPAMRNLTDDMIRRLAERGGIAGLNFCRDFLGDPRDGEDYLQQAARQAAYLVNVGGEEFPALGSDLDGIPVYGDFADCRALPRLADRMKKEGLALSQIEKIFCQNTLRLYRELL